MLSRPVPNASTDSLARFEAEFSCALFGGPQKRQIVFTNCYFTFAEVPLAMFQINHNGIPNRNVIPNQETVIPNRNVPLAIFRLRKFQCSRVPSLMLWPRISCVLRLS